MKHRQRFAPANPSMTMRTMICRFGQEFSPWECQQSLRFPIRSCERSSKSPHTYFHTTDGNLIDFTEGCRNLHWSTRRKFRSRKNGRSAYSFNLFATSSRAEVGLVVETRDFTHLQTKRAMVVFVAFTSTQLTVNCERTHAPGTTRRDKLRAIFPE